MTVPPLTLPLRVFGQRITVISVIALTTGYVAMADDNEDKSVHFSPENLVISRSVYDNKASNVTVGATLPPSCVESTGSCVTAAKSAYSA